MYHRCAISHNHALRGETRIEVENSQTWQLKRKQQIVGLKLDPLFTDIQGTDNVQETKETYHLIQFGW